MSLFRWMISFLLVAVTLTPLAVSQPVPPPCVPDCFGDPFGPTQIAVFTTPSGCVVRVWYSSRLACGIYRDVAIQKVEIIGSCGTPTSMLMDEITAHLFLTNPMGFPEPDTATCDTLYRVTRGQCWRRDTIDCDGDTLMLPCGVGPSCCLVKYEVCRDSMGTKYVRPYGSSVTPDTCIVPPGASCENICTVPHYAAPPMGSQAPHGASAPMKASGINIVPNPATSSFSVYASRLAHGAWTLTILDPTGRTVIINAVTVGSNGKLEYTVSTNAMAPGIHFVRLNNDQQHLTTTVFIVR
ncbi:MAG: T9SS type A sorting domain-containing protein [Ignavibacteria bacterium]|nr:T9SS type A sorting domain-containing protein [Ignavibacteria bacterium]